MDPPLLCNKGYFSVTTYEGEGKNQWLHYYYICY